MSLCLSWRLHIVFRTNVKPTRVLPRAESNIRRVITKLVLIGHVSPYFNVCDLGAFDQEIWENIVAPFHYQRQICYFEVSLTGSMQIDLVEDKIKM